MRPPSARRVGWSGLRNVNWTAVRQNRRIMVEIVGRTGDGVTERTASRLVWVGLGCLTFLVLAGEAVSMAAGSAPDPAALMLLTFPIVGALIASRQPRNAIGWIMLAVGIGGAIAAVLETYAEYSVVTRPGSLPRPVLALALVAPSWIPVIGVMGTFLILLFPDGRLPSHRWRMWAWFCAAALAVPFIAILIGPGPIAVKATRT